MGMKTIQNIILMITVCVTCSFSNAQIVTQSEAVKVALKLCSGLRHSDWTQDSISSVTPMYREENAVIYEVVGKDGISVLLSGRKECTPVLGFILAENKPFPGAIIDHFEELPAGLRNLLDDYSNQVNYCIRNSVSSSNLEKWNNLLLREETNTFTFPIEISPLISTQWGQSESNDGCSGAYNTCIPYVYHCGRKCPAGVYVLRVTDTNGCQYQRKSVVK